MPKFAKGDRVRAKATLFDEGTADRNGLLFSQKWAADGHGEWCYGTVSWIYVRRGRQVQKYRVKYDEGTTQEALEEHLEVVIGEEDSDSGSDGGNEMGGSQGNDSDGSTIEGERVMDVINGVVINAEPDNRPEGETVTSESEGEMGEGNMGDLRDALEPLSVGDRVTVHGVTWERIEGLQEDHRTEPEVETRFTRLHFNDSTREVDVFLQLMPLSKEKLLQIVRDGAATAGDKRRWEIEHIEAALCVIFGGAQYKAGTNLWSTQRKGMLRAPDFGLHLSEDRFGKILRYWAKGPDGTREKLVENPWEEVDVWIRAFNKNRRAEIEVGTDVTPDEMMFEWTGQVGPGGIPFLSFIERKPKPLGTEGKSVCEGHFGICMYIELQKGKVRMARKKWCQQYKATTACTVRLIDKMGLRENLLVCERPARRVYADSWFASVETALALRHEMGVHFTGPIKTATKEFPIEAMRWTLAAMNRGAHIVLKCLDHENLWAVGWHDVHFKCYVTTNGTSLPGKPAPKKRQNVQGTTYSIPIPRPAVIAKYQGEMGYVDRHNRFRQGILHLPNIWKTKRWQTRIQLEILGLTLVDSFLACRKLMPKWQEEGDEESLFWKFVHVLLPQIDSRGRSDLFHEKEHIDQDQCHIIRLGNKRTAAGLHRGEIRAVQMRCSYCRKRNRRDNVPGRSLLTAWCCSVHTDVYICKGRNCWEEHVQEVKEVRENENCI